MNKRIGILLLTLLLLLTGCSTSTGPQENETGISSGDRDQMIADLTKAIEKDPDNVDLLLSRAYAYLLPATGSIDLEETCQKAMADLEKVLSIDPGNEKAIEGIYYCKLYRNQIEEAQQYLIDALEGKEVSDELKDLLEEVKEGNIVDCNGKQRMLKGYLDGKLVYQVELSYDGEGHVSSAACYDGEGVSVGEVDTVWNGFNYSTDYIITSKGNFFRNERTFDGNGNVIREQFYDMEGVLEDEYLYEVDDHGNITSVEYYHEGVLLSKSQSTYEYDEDGNVTKLYDYQDGELIAWILYERDEEKHQHKEECHNSDGSIRWYVIREYDEQGNQIHMAHYDGEGNLLSEEFASGN